MERLPEIKNILSFLCFVDRASLYNLFQMKPTMCKLLLSIFISTSLHVSGNYVAHHQEDLLYLFDTGTVHSVWLVCRPDSHPYRGKNTSVAKIQ